MLRWKRPGALHEGQVGRPVNNRTPAPAKTGSADCSLGCAAQHILRAVILPRVCPPPPRAVRMLRHPAGRVPLPRPRSRAFRHPTGATAATTTQANGVRTTITPPKRGHSRNRHRGAPHENSGSLPDLGAPTGASPPALHRKTRRLAAWNSGTHICPICSSTASETRSL